MLAFKKKVDVFNYISRIKRNKEVLQDIFNKLANARSSLRLPSLVFKNKPDNTLSLVIWVTYNGRKRASRALQPDRDCQVSEGWTGTRLADQAQVIIEPS